MSTNENSVFKAVPSKWATPSPQAGSLHNVNSTTRDSKQKALDTVRLDRSTGKLTQTSPATPYTTSSGEGGVALNSNQFSNTNADTSSEGSELIIDSVEYPVLCTSLGLPSSFASRGTSRLLPSNQNSTPDETLMSPGQLHHSVYNGQPSSRFGNPRVVNRRVELAVGSNGSRKDPASSDKGKSSTAERTHLPVPEIALQEEVYDSSADLDRPNSANAATPGGVKVENGPKTKWETQARYSTKKTGKRGNDDEWASDVPSAPSARRSSNEVGPVHNDPPLPQPIGNPKNVSQWERAEGQERDAHQHDNTLSLRDWDGGWAPAPICWEDRPRFQENMSGRIADWKRRSQLEGEKIDEFLENIPEHCEIVPPYWIPDNIEDLLPNVWWAKYSEDPDADLSLPPFWAQFVSTTSSFLKPKSVPVASIEDRDHGPDELHKAKNQTSLTTMKHHFQRTSRKANNTRNRIQQASNQRTPNALHSRIPRNQWSPRTPVYLRPAIQADMPQCLDIYNYYIEKTIFTPEMEPISVNEMLTRWEDTVEEKLPFIVAVDASQKNKRARNQIQAVVGFAYANDHNDMRGMFRYTVELEIFVRSTRLREGVGRTLMDKMMSLLDSGYAPRGGYEFDGNDMNYGPGGRRVIGNVLVPVPYSPADRTKLNWVERWLQQWTFHKASDFPEIGVKLGQKVSQAIFYRKNDTSVATWAP